MYRYEDYKPKLLTDAGQGMVLAAMVSALELSKVAGAFTQFKMLDKIDFGDTFTGNAIADRLVELGYLGCASGTWNAPRSWTCRTCKAAFVSPVKP